MDEQVNSAGLALAYQFVIPSYDWARDRLDKMHDRLQALQSVVVGVTLAVPVFVKSVMGENADAIDFGSWLFLAAMVIFVLTMIIGLIAQTAGTLTLLTPTALHDKYLGLSEDEFKKNALLYAGQHSEKNHRTVLRKGMAMSAMTGLFILEAVLLVIWVASG